jgi:ankyrin repeat protein
MALRKAAPWMFTYGVVDHEVSASEASAVHRYFDRLSKEAAQREAAVSSGCGLPLHCVASRAKGPNAAGVFTTVFNAYPGAARESNSYGSLPLHYVANRMGSADGGPEAMQLLLAEHPQAASEKNAEGDLPLHLICKNERGATLEMVHRLLSTYPQGINEKGMFNMKPHAMAVAHNSLPVEAIELLRQAEEGELSCN